MGTALIGGTGLTRIAGLTVARRETPETPYGTPSGPLLHGELFDRPVVFLARHGEAHRTPPHRVNYRAHIWALKEAGAAQVIAVAAAGGIHPGATLGRIVFPDQIIDYTWCRAQTFFEQDLEDVVHIDFTQPYCERLRGLLIDSARRIGLDALEQATYAATQGPRLETAAEVDRLERDGCHIVGMTGMPEAALAREAGLCYAACAVCANRAAGRGAGEITMDQIRRTLSGGMAQVQRLLEQVLPAL
jgi:5'-methylthioinosine phosphorylase